MEQFQRLCFSREQQRANMFIIWVVIEQRRMWDDSLLSPSGINNRNHWLVQMQILDSLRESKKSGQKSDKFFILKKKRYFSILLGKEADQHYQLQKSQSKWESKVIWPLPILVGLIRFGVFVCLFCFIITHLLCTKIRSLRILRGTFKQILVPSVKRR